MRVGWLAAGIGLALAGCATGPVRYPVEAQRYHHFEPASMRGPIAVEGVAPDGGPDQGVFTDAVRAELGRVGFSPADPGAAALRASVQVTRAEQPLPPRSSGLSIGIGGASFSGNRGGGVGLGGGVSFPIGGGRGRLGVVTRVEVMIRRGPDVIWDGSARTLSEVGPAADAAVAPRLARALFAGFPGTSGLTSEVR